jgi:cytoskeletal protein RodZ
VGGEQLETASLKQTREVSLGQTLVAARERRGLSREAVVKQAHIPAHYLQMLEDDDYRLISDRLYLLPFLRKYASFLEIDEDETAIRLVRDVQRVDNNAFPARLDEPLDGIQRYHRRNWSKPIMFSGLIAVIIGAYVVQSHHNEADTMITPAVQSPPAIPLPSISKGAMDSADASQSSRTISVGQSDSSTPQQSTSGATISVPKHTQSAGQTTIVPVATPDRLRHLQRPRTAVAGQVANH